MTVHRVTGPYREDKWPFQWIVMCSCGRGTRCNDRAHADLVAAACLVAGVVKFPFAAPTPPGASDAAGVAADVDEASAPPAAASAEAGASPDDASAAGLGGFDNH